MNTEFHGKRALVTGGGRGIGREIAESLQRGGAKTFVLTKSDSSVETLRRENPEIEVIQVDISDWDNARKAVESILPIDLLVNNAGINRSAAFVDQTEANIDDSFAVHYKATFNISQVVVRDLISRMKPGSIVNVSTDANLKHLPTLSVYGSSKAALDSLTKYMALELGSQQIRVNAVNPSAVKTHMPEAFLADPVARQRYVDSVPLGRIGVVREVADVVLFLLSDRASLCDWSHHGCRWRSSPLTFYLTNRLKPPSAIHENRH